MQCNNMTKSIFIDISVINSVQINQLLCKHLRTHIIEKHLKYDAYKNEISFEYKYYEGYLFSYIFITLKCGDIF